MYSIIYHEELANGNCRLLLLFGKKNKNRSEQMIETSRLFLSEIKMIETSRLFLFWTRRLPKGSDHPANLSFQKGRTAVCFQKVQEVPRKICYLFETAYCRWRDTTTASEQACNGSRISQRFSGADNNFHSILTYRTAAPSALQGFAA